MNATLCQIPGCAIRGRHLPSCEDDDCRGCLPRLATEGIVCDACTTRASQSLAEIERLCPDARLVAAGQVRRGHGGTGGKPGSQPPINLEAFDNIEHVHDRLINLATHIADTRGLVIVSTALNTPDVGNTIIHAAKWLTGQLRWLNGAINDQGQPHAIHAFATISECAAILRRTVNGPADQKYLGPCGAPLLIEGVEGPWPCEGDVYGVAGAEKGHCKTCGATVNQEQRRAWLDDVVRTYAYRASEIANAYGINVNTIRTWAHDRPALYDHAGNITRAHRPAVLHIHGHDLDGRPLFLLGHVLELAAEAAARREEARSQRARRREGVSV